ncbi:hypothetical protein WN944_026493 [Citrus x changshan-huyou]|uniref:Uncharacterized protein n=1 Tax=Citrus x changshan-huyou TaxID=2935761 RepID=A0AAP0LT48_9ROSI
MSLPCAADDGKRRRKQQRQQLDWKRTAQGDSSWKPRTRKQTGSRNAEEILSEPLSLGIVLSSRDP